jgi:hypothetical protein
MDATTKDGVKVVLKRVGAMSEEISIALHLSSAKMRSDRRNRSAPVLAVISAPDDTKNVLLVMPYLRPFNSPPFHCRGEFIEAIRQLLEVRVL